jgi:hypothetical protein
MLKRQRAQAAWLGLAGLLAGSAARAQTMPGPAALIANCGGYSVSQAAWAIDNAASCRLARDIYAACAGPSIYHLHADLVFAFQERCERDLEGRLSADAQRRLAREQARCEQGMANDQGIVGNFGERIIRQCQARVAAKFADALAKQGAGAPRR